MRAAKNRPVAPAASRGPGSGRRQQASRDLARAMDDVLERARLRLSRLVLAIQRAYCDGLVNGPLSKRPELLHHLWKISRASEAEAREMTLADPRVIFDRLAPARGQLGAALFSAGAMGMSAMAVAVLASAGGPLVASIGWLLEATTPVPDSAADYRQWRETLAVSGVSQLELLAAAAAGAAVLLAWTRTFVTSARTAASRIRALHNDLRRHVHQRMFAAYHELINTSDGETLRVRVAPGLAGSGADGLLVRTEAGRVRALAFDLGAGAIAISGGRGVGKTTLLDMLAGNGTERGRRAALVVNVAAPVKYQPREFLLHLHGELATAVLNQLGAATGRRVWAVRARALLLRLANSVLVAVGLMAVLTQFLPDLAGWFASLDLPVPDGPEAVLLLVVVVTWLVARATSPAARGTLGRADRLRDNQLAAQARRHLERIRFLQTIAAERQGLLGRGGVQLGWRRSRQLSEQPMTLPELVASYRTFAATVALWWHQRHGNNGKLLIGIDEVDRIVDADLAELFLNETKAIFGVPHCVYIVSVSEEALANFERRVARVRTVFDSAFDETIRLTPLAAGESVELLRRRLVGVPDRFLLLCHCLAGGMPRDVLRKARTMLHIHLEHIGGSPLVDITRELVTREIATVKRGFLTPQDNTPIDPALAAKLSTDSWPGTTPEELRTSISDLLGRHRQTSPSPQQTALGAALHFYTTVLELFTNCPTTLASLAAAVSRPSMRTPTPDRLRLVKSGEPLDTELQRWLAAEAGIRPTTTPALGIIDSLDHAYQVLQTNPSAAIATLSSIHERLGLQPPNRPPSPDVNPGAD